MTGPRKPMIWVVDGHLKQPFYEELTPFLEAEVRSVTSARAALGPDKEVDLLVVNDEDWAYTGAAVAEFRRHSVPTLHLSDGILEWFNLWHNPRTLDEARGSPLFQPVLSDKIACLGRSQVRFLNVLGNQGKCEVTGSPRFDPFRKRRRRERPDSGPIRVLVATARTPSFTAAQRERVVASLQDLKSWFQSHQRWEGVSLVPEWRLTDGLDRELGVTPSATATDLATQLEQVDAVVSTPSSLQLEAMVVGLPVALLDYSNRPHLVPAPYTITGPEQLHEGLAGILAPSPQHRLLQQMLLEDSLEPGPASPRVAALAMRLVKLGRIARLEGKPIEVPASLLPRTPATEKNALIVDLATRNPGHAVFRETDPSQLQAEVARLRRALRLSPWQILYRSLCEIQRFLWERRY